jgi:hypothetical protein
VRSIGVQPSDKEEDLVQETPEATLVAEHQYVFERHDEKLVAFAFMAIFVSYCPQFRGSEVIYKAHGTEYMFERHDQKLIIFMFLAVFVSYCPQSWVFMVIYKALTLSTCLRGMTKICRFYVVGPFHELLPTVLGLRGDLQGL